MRTLLATAAAVGLLLSSTAVWAQDSAAITPDQSFDGVDTDRDGLVSWAEFELVFPEYNESQFDTADLDGDGALSPDEFDNLVISTGSVTGPTIPTESLSSMSGDDDS